MIEVQLVRLSEDMQPPAEALDWISRERRIKIARYRRSEDGKRSLIAELLMRRAAALRLSVKPGQLTFDHNPYGRPYLANVRHFKFSVSHSGEFVVIAVGRRPIGVDVERVGRCELAVATRFFSPAEADYIRSLPESEQARTFTTLWTLKESYTKAEGKGLLIPFPSFGFQLRPDIRLVGGRAKRSYSFETIALGDYCLSICHSEPGAEIVLRTMAEEELYEQYRALLYDR